MDWLDFSVVIACLLVSAFFAASETALTGASRASMLRLSKQGNREAAVVSSLSSMRERLIGALLLGNNIANIGASALATGLFTAWFGEPEPGEEPKEAIPRMTVGRMLLDLEYAPGTSGKATPQFFSAEIRDNVLRVPQWGGFSHAP